MKAGRAFECRELRIVAAIVELIDVDIGILQLGFGPYRSKDITELTADTPTGVKLEIGIVDLVVGVELSGAGQAPIDIADASARRR